MWVTGETSGSVSYEVSGSGQPVILICGFGGRGEFWRPVADRLSRRFTVVTFDHPGVGGSALPAGYSVAGIAQAIQQLAEHLDIGKAHVVGHSTGGLVAQTLALDCPGLVDRLVLSGSWARPDQRLKAILKFRNMIRQRIGEAAQRSFSEFFLYPAHLYGDLSAYMDEQTRVGLAQVPAEVFDARIKMLLAFDRRCELGQVCAFTLVIGALDDQLVPISHSRELAALIRHASIVELEGGHFFPVIHPERYAYVIEQHLECDGYGE